MTSPYLCRHRLAPTSSCTRRRSTSAAWHGPHRRVLVESGRFDGATAVPIGRAIEGLPRRQIWETLAILLTMKARMDFLRVHGSSLARCRRGLLRAGDAARGMEVHVRMRAASPVPRNTPSREWVNWPGLNPALYALAQKYFRLVDCDLAPRGNDLLIKGAQPQRAVIDGCSSYRIWRSIGDANSLVIHPASTTHRQLSERPAAAGVSPGMVGCHLHRRRSTISVGTSSSSSSALIKADRRLSLSASILRASPALRFRVLALR